MQHLAAFCQTSKEWPPNSMFWSFLAFTESYVIIRRKVQHEIHITLTSGFAIEEGCVRVEMRWGEIARVKAASKWVTGWNEMDLQLESCLTKTEAEELILRYCCTGRYSIWLTGIGCRAGGCVKQLLRTVIVLLWFIIWKSGKRYMCGWRIWVSNRADSSSVSCTSWAITESFPKSQRYFIIGIVGYTPVDVRSSSPLWLREERCTGELSSAKYLPLSTW